ncbi:MAG: 2-hydroxyacyl-CoA dehydratase [Dehalococcoidia bacterium]|jgi:benzoyl-CoA reductase subunit C|nr:2-hydroxyacyl-CoA dehydratase [Dehalococcoidia bacterium]
MANLLEPWGKFGQMINDRHAYAQQWKTRNEGKVMGYFCTYVPEEIFYAAGVLPVRILGSHEPEDITSRHIYGAYCPHSRDCLAQGLRGKYDYLDGIAMAQTCMHIRQAFDSWRKHVPVDYICDTYVPNYISSPHTKKYLVAEFGDIKRSVEDWVERSISDRDLDRAIEIYNRNRRLMREVYELRKQDPPLLSGAETMEMVVSSQMMDKEEHTHLLEEALAELHQGQHRVRPGTRLMMLGSVNDDIGFIRAVETLGANIVIDDHCTGSRYFWIEVIPEEDRLAAIAQRYIDRPPCPHKDYPEGHRIKHILKLTRDWNVKGGIIAQQKFCDFDEFDIPFILEAFKGEGIESLWLELDVVNPVAQFRTRIEAFLEMLDPEVV